MRLSRVILRPRASGRNSAHRAPGRIGRPIIVAAHRRSGTHLAIDLLRRQFHECRSWKWPCEYLHHLYLDMDLLRPRHPWHIDTAKAYALLERAPRPIVKTHGLPHFRHLGEQASELIRLFQAADTFYVLRDGRDVLCSMYAWSNGVGSRTQCSLSEYMREIINGGNRVQVWADHVRTWLQSREVKVLRYEDIISQPRESLKQLEAALGLKASWTEPLVPRRVRNRWHRRWVRLVAVWPQSTAVLGKAGGARPPKWRETFSPDDRALFHEYAGDVLTRFGYVQEVDWVDEGC